jgi:uncharacterized membrane protein
MKELVGLLDKIAPTALWVVLSVVVLFTGVAAGALSYHWREYAVDAQKSKMMFNGYLIVSGILVAIMVLAILLYQNGI